ncbi:MAG: chromosome segregation protein SMC, partial [Bacteroidia bacterium]|nr:chromosome segregation protein SMC [Bacteroidia bacterium]
MRLKKIEIKGFKSFGDKVVLNFDKGVTSVVGPNGSGKSNIVDAMRWVLGEQKTRMLRSEKMENVIFNGTKTRKPANLAEVSLTFENTKNIIPVEFNEVTVTRKLFRNGESEYSLNQTPCRLKDITDLFLDTGIGPDSYAIIELKMVDEILNDHDNSIKLLFEEAAGISKYKIRKKQTLHKLEETEADLARVNDLLFEIERNMKTLESQAKKAERYKRLQDNYKEHSVELAAHTLEASGKTFEELSREEENLLLEKTKIETRITEEEALLQKQKLASLEFEKALSQSQHELNEKINFIRQQENDKKISNERLIHLQDKEGQLTLQLQKDKSSHTELEDNIKAIGKEKISEEKILTELNENHKKQKEKAEKARSEHLSLQENLNSKITEAQAIQAEIHETEKHFAVSQVRLTSLQQEIERHEKDNGEKNAELNSLKKNADEALKLKSEKEKELTALESELSKLNDAIASGEEEIKSANDVVMESSRKSDARQNEYNLTKSLIENMEGYPESLKYLKKNSASVSRAPLLSDILSCKQEYRSTLENFLEPFMNYFIVDSKEDAGNCVNLLSEASKGRASFFVLSSFKNETEPITENIPNCIHAMQVVDVDQQYRKLCTELLRNVYIVVKEQENTPQLDDERFSNLVFISQNGKYCKTKYSLSGGSVGLFDGKRIGRIKNLESLEAEMEMLGKQAERNKAFRDKLIQKQQSNKKQTDKIISEKEKLSEEAGKLNNQYATLIGKAEQLNTAIVNNNTHITSLRTQMKVVEQSSSSTSGSANETLKNLLQNFSDAEKERLSLQQKFSSATEALNVLNEELNQLNIQCLQQQNKIATIIRDLGFKHNLLETLQETIASNTTELETTQKRVGEIVNNSVDFDSQLLVLYSGKELTEKKVAETETRFYTSRSECDNIEKSIRNFREQRENSETLLSGIKEKVTEIKLQLASLKERLSVEFNIAIEEIAGREPSADTNETELREKIIRIKNQ